MPVSRAASLATGGRRQCRSSAPAVRGTIWVGTGEASNTRTVYMGAGLYRSQTDVDETIIQAAELELGAQHVLLVLATD